MCIRDSLCAVFYRCDYREVGKSLFLNEALEILKLLVGCKVYFVAGHYLLTFCKLGIELYKLLVYLFKILLRVSSDVYKRQGAFCRKAVELLSKEEASLLLKRGRYCYAFVLGKLIASNVEFNLFA